MKLNALKNVVLPIVILVMLFTSGLVYFRAEAAIQANCESTQNLATAYVELANVLFAPRTLGPQATPEEVAYQNQQNGEAEAMRKQQINHVKKLSCKDIATSTPDPKPVPIPPLPPQKTGPNGAQGPEGLNGPAGPPGPIGPKGDSIQGVQGPQGIQGIQGPKGDTGTKGDTGSKGDMGPKGDKGDKGDPGEPAVPTTTVPPSSTTTTVPPATTTTTCVVCLP